MLTGKGTEECPLVSTKVRLMDIRLMMAQETNTEKIVMIVESSDELHAFAFELEDFHEIIQRGARLFDG